jgi:iron complex transport system ATP-binding protein
MVLFELDSVGCSRALSGVTLRFRKGEFVALCGLNGAGKSTLLEIMCRLLVDFHGSCAFQGRAIGKWSLRELARQVSFLPQSADGYARFTALEVVHMGRYPHGGGGWLEKPEDRAICLEAMQLAGCEELADRYITELSGGERQRVLFAAALAQKPAALLLDEPGTFVDLPHQVSMFRTLHTLCRSENVLCVAATHDLNLAAAFCSRIVLLDQGRVVADGTPAELLTGAPFQRVFGQHVRVESNPLRVHYEV